MTKIGATLKQHWGWVVTAVVAAALLVFGGFWWAGTAGNLPWGNKLARFERAHPYDDITLSAGDDFVSLNKPATGTEKGGPHKLYTLYYQFQADPDDPTVLLEAIPDAEKYSAHFEIHLNSGKVTFNGEYNLDEGGPIGYAARRTYQLEGTRLKVLTTKNVNNGIGKKERAQYASAIDSLLKNSEKAFETAAEREFTLATLKQYNKKMRAKLKTSASAKKASKVAKSESESKRASMWEKDSSSVKASALKSALHVAYTDTQWRQFITKRAKQLYLKDITITTASDPRDAYTSGKVDAGDAGHVPGKPGVYYMVKSGDYTYWIILPTVVYTQAYIEEKNAEQRLVNFKWYPFIDWRHNADFPGEDAVYMPGDLVKKGEKPTANEVAWSITFVAPNELLDKLYEE